MKHTFAFLLIFFCSKLVMAQTGFVGIGTTEPRAALHIRSPNSGILVPKYITLADANARSLPTLLPFQHTGLMIFVEEAANQGFWYYDGTAFVKVAASSPTLYTSDGAITTGRTVELNNNALRFLNGRVGIGTTEPTAALYVQGSGEAVKIFSGSTGANTALQMGRLTPDALIAIPANVNQYAPISAPGDLVIRTEGAGKTLHLVNDQGMGNGLSVRNNQLGIGIPIPSAKLHIVQPEAAALKLQSGAVGRNTSIEIGRTGTDATIGLAGNGGEFHPNAIEGDLVIRTESFANRLFLNTSNLSNNGIGFTLFSNRVGIGTPDPTEKLEVVGTVKSTGLLIPVNAGVGKVLTSDGGGRATWQTPSASGATPINLRVHGIQGRNYSGQEFLNEGRGFKNVDYENNSVTPLANSNWNTTTGAYTVPVEGLYHIDYQITIGSTNAQYISGEVLLHVNATDVASGFQSINTRSLSGYGFGFRTTLAISTDYYLRVNDQVRVKLRSLLSSDSNGHITTLENNVADFLNIRLIR